MTSSSIPKGASNGSETPSRPLKIPGLATLRRQVAERQKPLSPRPYIGWKPEPAVYRASLDSKHLVIPIYVVIALAALLEMGFVIFDRSYKHVPLLYVSCFGLLISLNTFIVRDVMAMRNERIGFTETAIRWTNLFGEIEIEAPYSEIIRVVPTEHGLKIRTARGVIQPSNPMQDQRELFLDLKRVSATNAADRPLGEDDSTSLSAGTID